ncbi:MAG: hypothetical protein ABIJ86_16105, partial [Spirochaetota bacterium]
HDNPGGLPLRTRYRHTAFEGGMLSRMRRQSTGVVNLSIDVHTGCSGFWTPFADACLPSFKGRKTSFLFLLPHPYLL